MIIVIKEDRPLLAEAAGVLDKEWPYYPLARLVDLELSTEPLKSGIDNILIKATFVPEPKYHLATVVHITMLRDPAKVTAMFTELMARIGGFDRRQNTTQKQKSGLVIPGPNDKLPNRPDEVGNRRQRRHPNG